MKKDTIYIDIEDDITSIIDKVKNANAKVVALVPPKRSTTLNSAVNLKLLNKAAEEADKRPVLVTNEAPLLGLAGGVGMYVAQNLHSKPYIPDGGNLAPKADGSVIDGNEVDPDTPIGELDAVRAARAEAKEGKQPDKAAKVKRTKRFKIPSFDRFRNRFFLIIGAVLLLALGWWWAFWVAPKAIVAIDAQTSSVDIVFEFTADTEAEDDDFEKNIFTAETKNLTDDVSEQFNPTGKKNVGEKATGTVTINNCQDPDDSILVEKGTIFTSPDGLKFELLDDVTVPDADGDFNSGCTNPGQADGNLRAVSPGAGYNLNAGQEYDVGGYGSTVYGVGSQMSGGTDKNVTVVAQKDVNEAKKNLANQQNSDKLSAMRDEFDEESIPINETYQIKLSNVTASPSVGQEADTATVSGEATQSMLGISRETISKALDDFLNARIEGGNQIIYDNGIDDLTFSLLDGPKDGRTELRLTATGYIGPDLNTDQLAEEIKGLRYSETVNYIKERPGVMEVDVNFEPFWVFTAPRADRIEFILNVDDGTD